MLLAALWASKAAPDWCVDVPYLWLRADSHLAEVDGEDGMRAGALGIHLCAGGGAGKSAQLQTLQQLRSKHTVLLLYSHKLSVVQLKLINV